jgi:TonB family protein
MSNRFLTGLAFTIFLAASPSVLADAPDYSKEAVVIEKMTTKVTFSAEGIREWQQTLSMRIQSEAAVRQLGVLSFSYGSESEQLKVEYVRVRKSDGSVIETPESSVRDVATEVAAAAPTYNDLREKQVPVKALGVGDVLEYSVRSSQQKPELGGQFWYTEYFASDRVVLDQTLEISVPKERFVHLSSPKVKVETHDNGDRRFYLWPYSHLEPSKPDSNKKPAADDELPKVQITSFRNWEEVGNWWGALASAQAVVTPAIQDKAKELTAGLSSNSDKAKSIYNYVSLKYRYISISLGAGQYRPHSAAEVLANQYGDCKDKHTLFVALLKAAGIQAWPALIGAGMKFDVSVPSPAQFNHVITVLPQGGQYTWLDTTSEVAPFGLLVQSIRDEQALVIPSEGKPLLVKTPLDPPFLGADLLEVKGALDADGTLTARFDYRLDGDNGLVLRSAFRQLAPAQWPTLAQQISYALGFAGDVSGVDVENLESTGKPFHYSYDYSRKNYSAWSEHKLTPPIPPLGFGPGDEAEKPDEPFWVGLRGTLRYRASVQLPKGLSIELPKNVTLKAPFAEYSASYSLKDGLLTADRELLIKQAKVPIEQWADYQTLSNGMRTDQTTFMTLSDGAPANAPDYNPEAEDLLRQAGQDLQAERFNEAHDLLVQAERLSPKEPRLWAMYSYLAMRSGKLDEAINDGRKEIQFHPDELAAYQQLGVALNKVGRQDEAIEVWRGALKVMPEDHVAAAQLARLLMAAKRYSEVPAILEKPIAAAPEEYELQLLRIRAFLLGGRKEEGVAEAKKIAAVIEKPLTLNDLAYFVSDAGGDTGMARDWSQEAITQTEQTMAAANLANLDKADFEAVNMVAAEWDTLGWIYFHQNDLAQAEKYVGAAWQLGQQAAVADHLGQIYQKQGKKTLALHMWNLAVAADHKDEEVREHLRKGGVPLSATDPMESAAELGTLRTIKIPALPKQTGSAEFFLLVSRKGIESVQLIGESPAFKDAGSAIQAARYEFPFPDQGPEKLIRRAILSCSTYTSPSCQLTLLLPSTTTVVPADRQSTAEKTESDSGVKSPQLLSKVQPEYSEEARAAHLEGAVLLSAVVNQQGVPEDVAVLKPLGLGLDESAKQCVKQWRFDPAMKDGKPVSMRVRVEVNFELQKPQQ